MDTEFCIAFSNMMLAVLNKAHARYCIADATIDIDRPRKQGDVIDHPVLTMVRISPESL